MYLLFNKTCDLLCSFNSYKRLIYIFIFTLVLLSCPYILLFQFMTIVPVHAVVIKPAVPNLNLFLVYLFAYLEIGNII